MGMEFRVSHIEKHFKKFHKEIYLLIETEDLLLFIRLRRRPRPRAVIILRRASTGLARGAPYKELAET